MDKDGAQRECRSESAGDRYTGTGNMRMRGVAGTRQDFSSDKIWSGGDVCSVEKYGETHDVCNVRNKFSLGNLGVASKQFLPSSKARGKDVRFVK